MPAVELVGDPRRRREHRPGSGAERRDLRPERRIGLRPRSGRRRGRGRRCAPALAQPPAKPRGKPPREPPAGAKPAHVPRLRPHPRRHGAHTPGAPRPPGAPDDREGAAEREARGRDPARLAVVGGAAARAPGAVQRPRARDRRLRAVAEDSGRGRGVAERRTQPAHQPAARNGARGKSDVEGGDREGVERGARGRDAHPGVRPQRLLQRAPVVRVSRRLDADREVTFRIGEQRLGRLHQPPERRIAGLDGDDVPRHRVAAPGRRAAKAGVRNEVRELRALQRPVPFLPGPALDPAPLVPAEGVARRHQQAAAHLHPVAELGILTAIAGEGLVEASHLLEERPGDPEIVAGHGPERIVAPRGEVRGSHHVPLQPGPVEGPAGEQFRERRRPIADRRGIDPLDRHTGAEAERQRIRYRVVPAGVGREQPRFRDHVAVEKHEDVVQCRARPGVPGPRKPEPAPLLPHRAHGQRCGGGDAERRAGTVVDDDHLEQRVRIILALEPREGERQRPRRLEAGHDDADREGRPERRRRRRRDLAPVVAAHRGRARPGGGCGLADRFRRHRHGRLPAMRRTAGAAPSGRSVLYRQAAHSLRSSHGLIRAM